MKHFFPKTCSALAIATLLACSNHTVENAGEAVDQALTDTGNAVEDACEDIKAELDARDSDC